MFLKHLAQHYLPSFFLQLLLLSKKEKKHKRIYFIFRLARKLLSVSEGKKKVKTQVVY